MIARLPLVALALALVAQMSVAGTAATAEALNVVFLFDASLSVARVVAPFTWDGSRDSSGRPTFSGTRPPSEPSDLFGQPCRDTVAKLTADDRVRIGTFAATIRLSEVFSGGAGASKAVSGLLRVPSEERSGPSPAWDAIDEALAKIEIETETGRRVVILVTDGRVSGNRKGLQQVTERAVAGRVSISVIEVRQSAAFLGRAAVLADLTDDPWVILTNPLGPRPEVTLGRLARATGGAYEFDDSGGHERLGPRMVAIINGMRR